MRNELWQWIAGFEGLYEISSKGAIRSYCRAEPKTLNPAHANNGYLQVNLCKSGQRHARHVHVLVAATFLGERRAGFDVSHLNGDKADNRVENLTYESHSQNCARRREHGTAYLPAGELHHNAKLTRDAVSRIFEMRAQGCYQKDIARAFGVTQSNISRVLSGRQWSPS